MEDEILTFDQIKKFKVAELKARLSSLGLQVSGLKADLVARLSSYYESLVQVKHAEDAQIVDEDNDNETVSAPPNIPEEIPQSEPFIKEPILQAHGTSGVSLVTPQQPEVIDIDQLTVAKSETDKAITNDEVKPVLSEMVSLVDSEIQHQPRAPDIVDIPQPPIEQPQIDMVILDQPPTLEHMVQPILPQQPPAISAQQLAGTIVPDNQPKDEPELIQQVQHVSEPAEVISEHIIDDSAEPVQQDDELVGHFPEPVQQKVSEFIEQVSEPVTQVSEPVEMIPEPTVDAFEPVQQDNEPVEQFFEPVQQKVSELVQQVSEPVGQVAEPVQQEISELDQHIAKPVEQVVTDMVTQAQSRSEEEFKQIPFEVSEPTSQSTIEPEQLPFHLPNELIQEKNERGSVQDDDIDIAMNTSQNDVEQRDIEESADFEQETPKLVPEVPQKFPVEEQARQEPEKVLPRSPVKQVTQVQDSVRLLRTGRGTTSQHSTEGEDSGYQGEHEDNIAVPHVPQEVGKKKKKKKKRKKKRETERTNIEDVSRDDEGIEVEYIPEELDAKDPVYAQFAKIFETFKLSEKADAASKKDDSKEKNDAQAAAAEAKKNDDEDNDMDTDSDEEEETKKQEADTGDKVEKLSKKKLKLKNRMSVAELKQHVSRPDVVEMHDVTAPDPKLLVYLKACRNTVPVPRHWCFKRKFLQGKRGIIKPPFQLPEFIQKTGIMEMREALQEKEDAKNMKAKMREKVRPKMGKIDIDYQKLHDAFFKWQTKPRMTLHGDLYYEGKEFETKLKEKKPGDLSEELRTALGMPTGQGSHLVPPPWLIAMQRYGPPPSYPNLKIPGLNAPIPEGASFGYHAGGWGKPPVDEQGRPLYGDVFGLQQPDANILDDEQVDSTLWGELESESEESEESEEESEEEPADQSGLVTPAETGLVTPSGLTSIPAGMETPDMIELRKRKNIEEAMESGAEQPTLYTVLPEKRAGVGAVMMGSSHVYDLAATSVPAGTKKTPGGLSEGVEVALDPSELELDPAAMQARYDEQLREQQNIQKEDFSDMVAEHAARQQKKRKKTTDSGKAAKKYKEFKF